MVPVLPLLAIRKPLPAANQVFQLADGLLRVLALGAVQVTVKDTRVAVYAHEDEGVCKRFEARANPALEGLPNLRVVLRISTHPARTKMRLSCGWWVGCVMSSSHCLPE